MKRVFHVIMNVLLWILIIIIAFFAIVTFSQKGNGQVMHLFGYTPMTVLSDSMAPAFRKDDLIIVHQGDGSTYQVGDIISFWTVIEGRRSINTHRIAEVYDEGGMIQYATRGDANQVNDAYLVIPTDIIGRYTASVPLLGKLLALLSTSTGFLLIIILPILAFFLYQLYRFILLLIDLKRQTVIEATKAAMVELEQERQAAARAEDSANVAEDEDSEI